MAALPYMQLYVADYLADTMHLTTEEHGAYLLLIFNYWQTGKPIPVSRLARIARLSNDRWTDVERSLNEFFNERDNEWVHDRIERDLEAVHATQNQRIAAGKASAEARKQAAKSRKSKAVNERSTGVEVSLNENSTNREEKRTDTDISTSSLHDAPDTRTKFSMTPQWQPGAKSFQAVLTMNAMAGQTFDADQLNEFRSFWTASPDEHRTQAKWEHALAQFLKRDLRHKQASGRTTDGRKNTTGGRPARQGPMSAVDRVKQHIIDREAAAGADGQALDQDDRDVRPPLDVEFRRES